MKKKLIRLTESDLHRIVNESVYLILKEEVDTGQITAQSEKRSTATNFPDDVKKQIRKLRMKVEKLNNEGKDTSELTSKIKKLKSKYVNEQNLHINEVNVNDYDADYEKLIRFESGNLSDLESKVPRCYRSDIHRAHAILEGILFEIKQKSEISHF